jgi:integrase/recombinase XerD
MSPRSPAHHLRYDPVSRCAPLEEWPKPDQMVWQAAQRPGDFLEADGALAHRAPAGIQMMEQALGRYLTWLQVTNLVEAGRSLADQVTPERVAAYAEHLLERNAGRTVLQRLQHLLGGLRVLAPEGDWSFIHAVEGWVRPIAVSVRNKRQRVQDSAALFALGVRLMNEAEAAHSWKPLVQAGHFRDGLMIALLAARPVRARNFAMIVIGQHLVLQGAVFWLRFEAAETKTGMAIEVPVPEVLTPALERYLTHYRLCLLSAVRPEGDPPCDRLWISCRGVPMKENAIGHRINVATEKAFDANVNMNLFRDSLATSLALENPEHVRLSAPMLSHTTFATTERYYNQAASVEAGRELQDVINRRV